MSTISTILSTLRSAVWAIDVRDEIANAIEQCYKDVNSPSLVTDGIEEVIGDMVDNGRISGAIVEDLGLITEGTSNLFDFTTVTAGRLNTSTGEVGEASGYWTSDFIPVENGKTYYFANTDRRVAYNSSKAYSANISGTTWTASADGYIRVSVTSANRKTAKINEGSAKDYRPGRSPIDFNLRDDVYRKAEVDAALAAVTIATDPELETAGAAADAKATGDAISALNESLENIFAEIAMHPIWERGSIRADNGNDLSSTYSCRTKDYIENTNPITITPIAGVRFSWRLYQSDNSFISSSDWLTEYTVIRLTSGQKIRLTCGYIDGTVMNVSDADASISIAAYRNTDNTLTLSNKAADAKVVGDALTNINSKIDITLKHDAEISLPYLNAGNGAIINGGETNTSEIFCHTDYVDVSMCVSIRYKRNTYTSATIAGMAFYDENKTFISFVAGDGADIETRYLFYSTDVPNNAKYARFSIFTDTETYGEFAIYGTTKLYSAIQSIKVPSYSLFKQYTTNDDVALKTSSAEVFELYDELVATYPYYVSKNALTDSVDNIFTNYEYVFTFDPLNDSSKNFGYPADAQINKPVILISSGVHGYERSAVMSLYTVMRDICEDMSLIPGIAENAIIKVMPVVCPWGYDNNSRVNANGVNINRNFDTANWVLITGNALQYSGSEPANQPETRVYQDWIDANVDAFAHADVHNSEIVNEVSNVLSNNMPYKKRFLSGVQNIIPHFINTRNILPSDNVYCYSAISRSSMTGTTINYAEEAGIENTCTFELSWNVNSTGKHSNQTIGVGAEIIGNFFMALNNIVVDKLYR